MRFMLYICSRLFDVMINLLKYILPFVFFGFAASVRSEVKQTFDSKYYEYVDSAEQCTANDDLAGAESFLIKALRLEPTNYNNALIISNLATIQRMQGKQTEALNNYSLAINMMPKAVTFINNRGLLYLEMDSINLAERDFDRVIDLEPKNVQARFHKILIEIRRNQLDDAKRDLDDLNVISPKSDEYFEAQARWLQAKHKFSDAILAYTALLKKEKNVDWYICRAECYLARKNYNAALEDIAVALEYEPENGFLYLLKAKIRKEQYELSDCEKLLKIAEQYGISREECELFINM